MSDAAGSPAGRFSRLRGRLHIGSDFFARAGALDPHAPAPRGIVDDVAALSHAEVDAARMHPDVRRFFEDTAALALHVQSSWVFWFAPLFRFVLRPLLAFIGQLVLPLRTADIETRMVALDATCDGRPGARGVVRQYVGTGATMQVMAYATTATSGGAVLGVTIPLPGCHLAGLLRVVAIGTDADGTLAVKLSSRPRGAGIWLVTRCWRWFALPMPLTEEMSLWGAAMRCAPRDLDPTRVPGTVLVGRHVQRLFGLRIVQHEYWFAPVRAGGLPSPHAKPL